MSPYFAAGLLAAQVAGAPADGVAVPLAQAENRTATAGTAAEPHAAALAAKPAATSAQLQAPRPPAQEVAAGTPAIRADWARAAGRPAYSPAAARLTVHELVREDMQASAAERPTHFGAVRPDKYATFAIRFDEAAVPGCLGPNALKHQPPKLGPIGVGGILALPFLVAAAVRGKCN